jgi:thiamine biosynthesis lipoprotein
MGRDDGIAFARTHALAARFVSRGAHGIEEHMSPAFEHLLADDRAGAA